MTRWIAAAGFAVAALAFAPGVASAQQPAKPAAVIAPPHAWWNDEAIVQDLSLGADQRAKMDSAHQAYQASLETGKVKHTASEFYTAIEAGNLEQARSQVAGMPKTLENTQRSVLEFKLTVVQLLSDEQREKLLKGYPRLLRAPWGLRPGWVPARREAGPAPQAAPPGAN